MSTRFERNLYFLVTGKPAPRSPRKKPRRGPARDAQYLAWIRTLPCCACGRGRGRMIDMPHTIDMKCRNGVWTRSEAAHVGHDGGMKQKCSDYATVPLCAACHRTDTNSYHNKGVRMFAAIHCLDFDALVERYNQAYCTVRGIAGDVFAAARGGR